MSTRAPVELLAQRGNGAEFPENSLDALQSALQIGASRLLVDAQLSRDAEAFALRDADLRRITQQHGSALDLAAVDIAALRGLEMERFGDRFAAARIARIADVAQLLRDWPDVQLWVELRRASLARHGAERCINVVLSALRDCVDRLVIASRDLVVVELARQRGAAQVGWIVPDLSPSSQIKSEAVRPDYLMCGGGLRPAGSQLRHGAWDWVVLDVANGEDARALVAAGAQLLGTSLVRGVARELGISPPRRAPTPD
jgi:glycerophosphoryl diester phosphodiesterase